MERLNRRRTLSSSVLLIVVAGFALASHASAQTYQGAVRGQVRDPQGVIPGAEVTLVNEDTNAVRAVDPNEVGEYSFTSVLPGTYTVRVSLAGFKTEERKGFRIGTQQSVVHGLHARGRRALRADHRHRRGAARRARQRHASRRSLDKAALQNAADLRPQHVLRGDLDARRDSVRRPAVRALSGSVRRLAAVARRRAAARQRLPDRRRVDHRLRQPRRRSCRRSEAVEEMRVQIKTYDADMGRAAGGVFNTTAESGSNAWHGSALFVNKPGGATGQLFFAKRAGHRRTRRSTTTTGPGSLGGPIVKDQTFFWFSTDDYKQRSTRNNVLTLPTRARARRRLLADAQRAGQLVTIYDPLTTRPIRTAPAVHPRSVSRQRHSRRSAQPGRAGDARPMPLPTSGKSFNGAGDARRRSAGPGDAEDRSALERRVDDDRHVCATSTRRSRARRSAVRIGTIPGDPSAQPAVRTVNFFALNNIFVPNNTTAIAVRYGYNRFHDSGGNYPGVRRRDARASGEPTSSALTFNTFPSDQRSTGYSGIGHGGRAGPTHIDARRPTRRVSKLIGQPHAEVRRRIPPHRRRRRCLRRVGRHLQLHAGVHAGAERRTPRAPPPATRSPASCSAIPASGSIDVGDARHSTASTTTRRYVQDDYRVTSTLTLNFGLRYEYEPGMRERTTTSPSASIATRRSRCRCPGMDAQGRADVCGRGRLPDAPGAAAQRRRAARRVRLVADREDGASAAATASTGRRRSIPSIGESGDRRARLHGDDDVPVEHGRRPDAGRHARRIRSRPASRRRRATRSACHRRRRRHRLRRSGLRSRATCSSTRSTSSASCPAATSSRSATWAAGPSGCSSAAPSDATVNINQLDPQYLSLGTALQQTVPNPFFGNAAFGNLSRVGDDRARPAAAAVPAVRQRAGAPRQPGAARATTRCRCAGQADAQRLGARRQLHVQPAEDNQFGESNTYLEPAGQRARTTTTSMREFGVSLLDVPHRAEHQRARSQLPFGEGRKWLDERRRQRAARRLVGHGGRPLSERLPGEHLAVEQQLRPARQQPAARTSSPGVDADDDGQPRRSALTGWINPAAFTAAPAFTFGNAPRTQPGLRGPGPDERPTSASRRRSASAARRSRCAPTC